MEGERARCGAARRGAARRRDEGDGRRIARRAGGSETEEGTSEKENALSRARAGEGEGAERGWIKASTRGGNKERTKKVEEVGGGGWVPWSALIGSTWSDEKFNHPPIPTRPSSSSTSYAFRCLSLFSRYPVSFALSRRLNSHQMNLPHIYARPAMSASFYGSGRGDKVKPAGLSRRLRKHP